MTTRLLTMAALAWASSAVAGNWDAPVAPSDADAAVIEIGGHYYATPKGTGQFLRGSNSWGTQASLDKEGYEVIIKDTVDVKGNPGWGIFFPVVKGGDFLFTESNGQNMFCDAYNNSNTLSDGRGRITYKFTLNEDGKTYRITHEEYAPKTEDGGTCYLGWDGVTLGEKNVPVLAYLDPESTATKTIEDEETGDVIGEEEVSPFVDWAFIPKYLYAAYEAKVKLYEALNEAEDTGVQMDDIVEVYNNPAATAEEVEAAMQELTERLMNMGDSEVDVTNTYIKNGDCASTEGWSGFNTQSNHYEGEDGAAIDGQFFEKWKSGAALDDATLVQTITVPAGKYRLQADVIASWQSDGEVEVEGVTLYADGDAGRVESEPIYTGNGVPKPISIEFVSTGATKIGVQIKGTNANWVACDNFKLFFLGYIDNPNEIALLQTIKTLGDYNDEDVVFSVATKDEVVAMMGKCEDGKSGSEEEMGALVEEAKVLIAKVEAEIAAYVKLADFAAQVENDAEEYSVYGKLGEWLGDYVSVVQDHISDGDLTVAEIEEMIASYEEIIEDGVHEFIATEAMPGTDVSVLIKNRDMDEGDHWVNTWGNPQIPGWNPESTSPWGYDKSAGEFWNCDFDFYQDIEGLPAGKYTVSFQGFYRWGDPGSVTADWLNNPTDQSQLTAVLYGNSVETIFKSICEGRVTDVSGWSVTCGQDEEGNDYYIPNSMEQAQWVFTNHPELYHTEATAVVGNDGHLRIGIKGGSNIGNRWVIFDSFRLRYDGASSDLFYEEMEKQAAALAAKRDNSLLEHSLPQDLYDLVDAVVAKCDELVSASASSEDCLAYFDEIQDASAKIDAANKVIASILSDFAYYDNAAYEEWWPTELVSASFSEIIDIATTISGGEIAECVWATTADMEAMAQNLNAIFVSDVFKGAPADVSGDNKYDMTVVIRNPQLQDSSVADEDMTDATTAALDYWDGSSNAKSQWGLSEFWNANFDISQTIASLPAGYYVLACDGFYRWGSSDDAAAQHVANEEYLAAQLYAVQGENSWAAPLMAICSGSEVQLEGVIAPDGKPVEALEKVVPVSEESEETVTLYVPNTQTAARAYINAGRYRGNSLVFQSDGSDVKIGLKKDSLKSNDWTIFDNFQLYYVGQEAPDAIGAVAASTGKSVKQAIFTVGGVQVARPQRGVNIVVTTLGDGTKVTSKVLVK